eukprot:jgi/Chlat1/9063/Chrsp94S09271
MGAGTVVSGLSVARSAAHRAAARPAAAAAVAPSGSVREGRRRRPQGLGLGLGIEAEARRARQRFRVAPLRCALNEEQNQRSAESDASRVSSSTRTLDPELQRDKSGAWSYGDSSYGSDEDDALEKSKLQSILYPDPSELPDDKEMPIWEHLEELRTRILVSVAGVGACILGCFCFAKELILFLEQPVASTGVRFLQLGPGEFFFTTLKVSGYAGLLIGSPLILYEIVAFVLPGLTRAERKFLAPIVFGSSILFYLGLSFSYAVLTPAALNFFVSYSAGAVESIWSIDQYFEFVLVLMFSTGLAFQVPVIQVLLGQLGLVSSKQMFSIWRYVIVGAAIVAAVLTPSTDPLTQTLLAVPLAGLYFTGATFVRWIEPKEPSIEV